MRHTERHNTPFHQSTFNISHNKRVVKYFSLCSPRTEDGVVMASQFLLFRTLQYKMETFQYEEQPLCNTAIWCLIQYRRSIPGHHSRHPNEKVVNIIYRRCTALLLRISVVHPWMITYNLE